MRLLLLLTAGLGAALAARGSVQSRSNLVYGEADGRPLYLDACVPNGPGPFAGVILVHGGGWRVGSKRGDTRPLLAPITAAGLAWFSIDYRLAPAYRYPACLDDVNTAIRWVKAHADAFHVDPARLALLGESAGGHLVDLAAMRATPETRVAAVVDLYGPADLIAQERQRGRLSIDMIALFGRTQMDPTLISMMRAASPVTYVQPGLPPFLIVHGTADPIVAYAQSVELAHRLAACGDSCKLVTISGGGHAMFNWAKIDPGFKTLVTDWLVKTLAPRARSLAATRVHPVASPG